MSGMSDADLSTPRGAYESRGEVQFLDVRQQFELKEGQIEGAVHIPLPSLLAGRLEGLEKDRPVVVYCSHGARSEVGKLMLKARGFEAHSLHGGSEAWVAEGLPFDPADA